jgi:hypothetical protein
MEAPLNLPHRDYTGSNTSITVWDGVFSPDGNWLATLSNVSSTVTFWPLLADDVIRQGCEAVERNFTEAEWQQYFPGEPYRETCP